MQGNTQKWLGFLPEMNADRYTAIVVWLIGAWTTRQFILETDFGAALGGVAATVGTLVVQWILTLMERRVWMKDKNGIGPMFALVLDTLLNAAGLLPFVRGIGSTSVWAMLQEAVGTNEAFTYLPALAVSLTIGLVLAKMPEDLWGK